MTPTHPIRLPLRLMVTLLALLVSFGTWAAAQTLELQIGASADDAEEFVGENPLGPPGTVYLDSSDLEFVEDADTTQVVGLRFVGLELPQGAQIASAYVQFTAKEAGDKPTTLEIRAEASDDAAPFQADLHNLSSRPTSRASVTWTPPGWQTEGEAGEAERTPDLAPLLQEVLERPGWQSGNALVLLFTGSGHRTAWSVDGRAGSAPVLVVTLAEAAQPQPATPEPSAPEAATPEPVTVEPTTPEPTTPEPATSEPMTVQPTAPRPTARAQQARYELRSAAGAGVRGSLLIADYGRMQVLTLLLTGRETAGRGAALVMGDCAAPGAAVLILEPTGAGGLSTTLTRSSFAFLTQQDLQVSVYENPDASGAVLACGEVGE